MDGQGVGTRVTTPKTTRVRLRRDRGPKGKGRVYVQTRSAESAGTWNQAFDVVADTVTMKRGRPVRVIKLRRPAASTASGRANERRLAEWLTASAGGAPSSITGMKGGGEIRLDGDTMVWKNRGSGTMHAGRTLSVDWNETTTSVRAKRGGAKAGAAAPVSSRAPADVMQDEFSGALEAFRARGGMLFEKPATQAWHGVHPKTGEYLIARGNAVDGITIRTTRSDGGYTERAVAPDGAITDTEVVRADAALARRARVPAGTWVKRSVSSASDTVVAIPAPQPGADVVVIEG